MSKDVSTYPESAITSDTTASSSSSGAVSGIVSSSAVSSNTVSGIEVPDASTLMDSYANGLMDELFNDVEYALDEGLELPTETVQVEEPEPISAPQIVLPAALLNPPSSALSRIEEEESGSELALIRDELEKAKRRERRLDFLLLGTAFTALILTAGVWLSNRQNHQSVPTTNQAPRLSPEEVQAQSDAEFLAYLDRSLGMIERRAAMQPPTATVNNAAPPDATATASSLLPPVLVPGSSTGQPLIPQGSASGQRLIERVYVPLYQPPGGSAPTATATMPGSVPFRNIAETYGNTTASLPSPNNGSAATRPASPAPAPNSNQQAAASGTSTTPTAPVGTHTLVGVMELGERSAALFDIDGVTQRFFAGEAIASSGWTLVTVSNQEAIIRRNGEIRSVFVGQKF